MKKNKLKEFLSEGTNGGKMFKHFLDVYKKIIDNKQSNKDTKTFRFLSMKEY